MRITWLIKTKEAYLACDNDIQGMTRVSAALGRAAKAERLVMVGFRSVAVRKLNSLPERRKYDNRVHKQETIPTVDSSSLAERFRTTCPSKPSGISTGKGSHGLNVRYSSSRNWMGCRQRKSCRTSGSGGPAEGHEVKGATCLRRQPHCI